MEQNGDNGVILPFRQDASFYCRCAERYLDEDNLGSAAQYARKAYEMEPDNIEYAVTLAEVLNRMRRYEESAQVLLLLHPFEQLPSDALFGLASDFMGLEEFTAAQQCAEFCLNADGDPEYADRAEDLLDLLDDREELEIQIGLEEGEDCKLLEGVRVAKSMAISGRMDDAIKMLQGMKEQYPASDILDMELAVALFTVKSYVEAEQVLFGIFKRNSRHIRAHLLLAVLYRAENKHGEAQEELNRTVIDPDASPEELGYAGAVFTEFQEIDRAIDALERLREFLPYDKDMLHQLGYCYLKKGDRVRAEQAYRTLRESDESDTVAAYYEEAIRTEPPEAFLKSWSLHYEVPTAEYLKRKDRLQTVAKAGESAIKQVWEKDASFRGLMQWALFSVIVPFRRIIVKMLTLIGDAEAERLLRRFLMSYAHADDDKQFVFGALISMNAEPPFALYIGGTWQYGSVTPLTAPEKMPRSYGELLRSIQHAGEYAKMAGDPPLSEHLCGVAERVFLLYMHSIEGRYPKLTPEQGDAMAAAFVIMAIGSEEQKTATPEQVCKWYQVSRRRLENALQRIFRQLKDDKDS